MVKVTDLWDLNGSYRGDFGHPLILPYNIYFNIFYSMSTSTRWMVTNIGLICVSFVTDIQGPWTMFLNDSGYFSSSVTMRVDIFGHVPYNMHCDYFGDAFSTHLVISVSHAWDQNWDTRSVM